MAVNKKYYYMRLKENFFDSEEMVLLEAMPEGILYSNILIKMYLKSLKTEGRLMFKETIPYNPQMIATITRHQIGTVEKALSIFSELGLIEVLNDGAIYMNDIELFIGESSTEAERKKAARARIEKEKQLFLEQSGQMSGQMSDKCLPEIEIEIEKEKELNLDSNKKAHQGEHLEAIEDKKDKKLSKIQLQCKELIEYYNSFEKLGGKKKAVGMQPKRLKDLQRVLKSYTFEQCKQAIEEASRMTPRVEEMGFLNFSWIFAKDDNFTKVLEGNYSIKNSYNNYNTSNQQQAMQYNEPDTDTLYSGGDWE